MKTSHVRGLIAAILALILASTASAQAPQKSGTALYPLEDALRKGVVNARISLFNATDQQHVLDTIGGIDPGVIYATYVGVWGTIRQQDIDSAGRLATSLRARLPQTLLGGGVNESVSLSSPPQTLQCDGQLGTKTFAPAAMIDARQRRLGDTLRWTGDIRTATGVNRMNRLHRQVHIDLASAVERYGDLIHAPASIGIDELVFFGTSRLDLNGANGADRSPPSHESRTFHRPPPSWERSR